MVVWVKGSVTEGENPVAMVITVVEVEVETELTDVVAAAVVVVAGEVVVAVVVEGGADFLALTTCLSF